jgi:hypothetical protein
MIEYEFMTMGQIPFGYIAGFGIVVLALVVLAAYGWLVAVARIMGS